MFQGSHEDWDDAEAACAKQGGCLATFHSQHTFQAAQDAAPRGHRNDFLWIGLRRNDTGFFWVTGEAINITFLESITGQTEGTLKADPRHCFVLSRGKPLGRSNCHDANRYLCEHPASAKPTSAKGKAVIENIHTRGGEGRGEGGRGWGVPRERKSLVMWRFLAGGMVAQRRHVEMLRRKTPLEFPPPIKSPHTAGLGNCTLQPA